MMAFFFVHLSTANTSKMTRALKKPKAAMKNKANVASFKLWPM